MRIVINFDDVLTEREMAEALRMCSIAMESGTLTNVTATGLAIRCEVFGMTYTFNVTRIAA